MIRRSRVKKGEGEREGGREGEREREGGREREVQIKTHLN